MLLGHAKSYLDIRTKLKYSNLTFKILSWHSHCVEICNLDIQNPTLTFALSRNRLFWHSKSYFDIRTETNRNRPFWHSKFYFDIRSEWKQAILTFKILFWHSHWAEIGYFDIQNPILTFALSRNRLFFDIRNPISTFALRRNMLFGHSYSILRFALSRNMLFWHSKSYFDIHTKSK